MRIKRVVVNASPLICLSKSGLSDLLLALFPEIVVPDNVYQEITVKGEIDPASVSIFSDKKIKKVRDIDTPSSIVSWDLGAGESSVLSFALKNPDAWAVIDDREARRCAMSLGCRYTGTIGIILLAKRRGVITSVKETLIKLQNAGLWLSDTFIKDICRKAKED